MLSSWVKFQHWLMGSDDKAWFFREVGKPWLSRRRLHHTITAAKGRFTLASQLYVHVTYAGVNKC